MADQIKVNIEVVSLWHRSRSGQLMTHQCTVGQLIEPGETPVRSPPDEFRSAHRSNHGDRYRHNDKEDRDMRQIASWLFITVDGVVESPEKWVRFNEEVGDAIDTEMKAADALLLGRRTYEVFAGSWPQRTANDDPNAPWMNEVPKYVVSTTLQTPQWQNTTVLDGDIVEQITELRQQAGDTISINGSATLVRSLLGYGLLDRIRLFVMPTLFGSGARLPVAGDEAPLELASSRAYSNGVVSLLYYPESR